MGFFKSAMKAANKGLSMVAATQKAVDRTMQVVEESRNSAKPATRLSRYDVAMLQIGRLIDDYPHWPDHSDWQRQYEELQAARPDFIREIAQSMLDDGKAKILEAKTQKNKDNRTAKLVEALEVILRDKDCDGAWLRTEIKNLQTVS